MVGGHLQSDPLGANIHIRFLGQLDQLVVIDQIKFSLRDVPQFDVVIESLGQIGLTIAEGRVLDDLVDFSDFLPTLCDAVGISAPPVPKLDGRSFLPQLKGQPGAPRDWAYCWYLSKKKTVEEWARTQRYKLYRTGKFYDISKDDLERAPLKELTPEAQQARTMLQQALDQYQGVRPAALAVPAGER